MRDETSSGTLAEHTYPYMDAAVETGTSPILEAIESTRSKLDHALRTGTTREKERARAALVAYERALDLYRRLLELRYETAGAPASNMRAGTAITQ
jgi:hypothetical protein